MTKVKDMDTNINLMMRGQRVAMIATIVILLLAIVKFVTGYLFDSGILIADAFHSGIDSLAIFASWFGLWIASKKRSARFPYGLYRAETLVTLFIGAFVTWAGIENLMEGYKKVFQTVPEQEFPLLPVIVSGISVFVSYFVAKMESEAGELINSGALKANASEAFLDIGISVVVLAGILLSYARIPYVEGAVIMFIALLIMRLGVKNIWTPVLILMDANLDPQLQAGIEKIISSMDGVKELITLKIRQSGPFSMVECEIATSPNVPVHRAHELADRIEEVVKGAYDRIESVFVHVEPVRYDSVSVILPVKEMDGLDSKVYGHFGRSPYYIILKLDDKGVPEIEDFYYNQFLGDSDNIHVAVKVIKAVIKHDLDIVFTPKIGEIAFHMLKDNFIDIYRAETGEAVSKVVEKFNRGRIEAIKEPHPVDESMVKFLEAVSPDH